jgi:hypothetical protein
MQIKYKLLFNNYKFYFLIIYKFILNTIVNITILYIIFIYNILKKLIKIYKNIKLSLIYKSKNSIYY